MWSFISKLWSKQASEGGRQQPAPQAAEKAEVAAPAPARQADLSSDFEWHRLFENLEQAKVKVPLMRSRKVQVGALEICLSQVPQGFFAVQDSCPHLGASLSSGTCNHLGEVICPWHSYRFSLLTGEESTPHGLQARRYPVAIRTDGIFLGVPAAEAAAGGIE